MTPALGSDPLSLIAFLGALSLLPLVCIVGTSFLKFSIVLMVVRNAIGVQQVPPQIALYSIALCLTAFVMAPVGSEIVAAYDDIRPLTGTLEQKLSAGARLVQPWREFLARNTDEEALSAYVAIAKTHWPLDMQDDNLQSNLAVMLPAFTISELKAAFEMGFLLYIPFIVIDIVVSNILLALGMQMVAPMTFSTPLKLLLFVSVDGWSRLLGSLANTNG